MYCTVPQVEYSYVLEISQDKKRKQDAPFGAT